MVRRTVKLVCCFAILLGIASLTHACIYQQCYTVHFHAGMPDFGTPPRRSFVPYRGEADDRPIRVKDGYINPEVGHDYDLPGDWSETASKEWVNRYSRHETAADQLLTDGKWELARRAYQRMGEDMGWNGELRDRYELAAELHGSSSSSSSLRLSIKHYLHGIELLHKDKSAARAVFIALTGMPTPAIVRAHALYQAACAVDNEPEYPRSVRELTALINSYPKSLRIESTLIMIGRYALLAENAKDRLPKDGIEAIQRLMRRYTDSRFYKPAKGLLARVIFLNGGYERASNLYVDLDDLASAQMCQKRLTGKARETCDLRLLAAFCKRLLACQHYDVYARTLKDIDTIRRGMSAHHSRRLAQWLLHDPELASAYLYYRLYHSRPDQSDIKTLVRLADRIVAKHPETIKRGKNSFSPQALARLAETYYQAGRYRKALTWAERSMAVKLTDRGLWMRGSARYRLGQLQEATADFRDFIARYPKSHMLRGAREQLAIMLEDAGDLSGALDQHFAINSTGDIAFFLDARMTVAQVEDYAKKLTTGSRRFVAIDEYWDEPRHIVTISRRELLNYTLGMRYLRAERWNEAERSFRNVAKNAYDELAKRREENRPAPDPITACRDLRRLKYKIATARGAEAKAEAEYAYASYYYKHGTLLLYNPALWQENRVSQFNWNWNKMHANKADLKARREHLYDHDVYAYSLKLCLELARKYPRTKAAPKALYRASCSADHLSSLNELWREEDKRVGLSKRASNLMSTLARKYPRNPLADPAKKYARVFREGG